MYMYYIYTHRWWTDRDMIAVGSYSHSAFLLQSVEGGDWSSTNTDISKSTKSPKHCKPCPTERHNLLSYWFMAVYAVVSLKKTERQKSRPFEALLKNITTMVTATCWEGYPNTHHDKDGHEWWYEARQPVFLRKIWFLQACDRVLLHGGAHGSVLWPWAFLQSKTSRF